MMQKSAEGPSSEEDDYDGGVEPDFAVEEENAQNTEDVEMQSAGQEELPPVSGKDSSLKTIPDH